MNNLSQNKEQRTNIMKKALFIFFTVLSLLSYASAVIVLYTYHRQFTANTHFLLILSILIVGLLSGLLSTGTKNFLNIALTGYLAMLHKINVVLLIIGSLTFLFFFFSK